jgi:hypothetical protein
MCWIRRVMRSRVGLGFFEIVLQLVASILYEMEAAR